MDIFQLSHKYPILTREEEVSLVDKMNEGDQEALKDLVLHNLRPVYRIANSYGRKLRPNSKFRSAQLAEDLFQEGIFGLYNAAEYYRVERGVRFNTFAEYRIKQAIRRSLREYSALTTTPHERLFMFSKTYSLNQSMNGSSKNPLYTRIPDPSALTPFEILSNQERSSRVEEEIEELEERDRKIIKLRFKSEEKYAIKQIGEELGITNQMVSILKKEALRKLRQALSD